jgi:3',5'-cyclic AMP phosphodiesterase CpdA
MISENRTEEFEIYVFGDTQVSGPDEINYLMKCISSIDREKPLFVITEGDNVYNTLNLYPEYLKAMSTMNLPIYYVPGNHDLNFESKNDEFSLNTFNDLVSPSYYSFNYGKIHFVVLDDVFWDGKSYHGEFGEKQLNWLKNDLKYVPEDILIVLNMHIPLCSFARNSDDNKVHDSSELFKILKNKKVLSLAGHTHTLERYESGDFLEGWDKSPSLSSNNHRSGLRFMVDGEN